MGTGTQIVGGTNTQREFNMGLEEQFLDKLYEIEHPNQEFQASYKTMAERVGMPANIIGNVIQFMEDNNLLTRRFEWNRDRHGKPEGGRQAFWTIKTDHDHAANLLKRFHVALAEGKVKRSDVRHKGNPWLNDNVKGGRPGRVNGQMELPVVDDGKMIGPDLQTDNRKVIKDVNLPDEVSAARAVVENVRSYINARQLAKDNLTQLRAAGMNVNEEAYFASIQMPPNAEADAISLVLPYIDFVESRVEYYRGKKK